MAFRLLEYTCQIMRRDLNNGKTSLPVVVPLVLYTGKYKYPYSQDIYALFVDEKFAKKCLCQPFHLVDLSEIPDEELIGENWSNVMAMLMKHITSRDLINVIESMFGALQVLYQEESEDYFWTSINYVLDASELTDFNDLAEMLSSISSEIGDKVMTTAERIFAKGQQEGISQGISQGVTQGRKEGYLQGLQVVVRNMLAEGADPKIIARVTGLAIKDIELLRQEHVE